MNKIVNINLGGLPFSIDEDAYSYLSSYLDTIHRHFKSSDGYEEITFDIEARLAELFQEELGDRPIVTRRDVEAAILTMGTPEEFGAEPMEEPTTFSSKSKFNVKTGKKLYRDSEDKVIGGVCAGLAAYFGIADPLWVRIILVVLFFSSIGFLVPAYILMWIIVPEAKTSSDRLAMRGEPINVSNIGKMVEEEMSNLSSRISELGGQLNDEMKAQKKNINGQPIKNFLAQVIYVIGQIFRAVFDAIMYLWKPLLFVVIFALLIVFIVTWIAGIIGFFAGAPFSDFIFPSHPWLMGLGFFNALLLIAIPILSIVLFFTRLATRFRVNKHVSTGLSIFWGLNIVCLFLVGTQIIKDFQTGAEVNGIITEVIEMDTLRLTAASSNLGRSDWFGITDTEGFFIDEDVLHINDQVDINILKSESNTFEIAPVFHSRGADRTEATTLASDITFNIVQKGNEWIIPTQIRIPRGDKYRGQQIELNITIPEGKHLLFDEEIARYFHRFKRAETEESYWRYDYDKVWTMTETGLAVNDVDELLGEKQQTESTPEPKITQQVEQ